MIDLNVKAKTVKLLEENMGENFMTLSQAKIYWVGQKKHET